METGSPFQKNYVTSGNPSHDARARPAPCRACVQALLLCLLRGAGPEHEHNERCSFVTNCFPFISFRFSSVACWSQGARQHVVCISPQLRVQCHHVGSLKLAVVEVFTPWNLAKGINQEVFPPPPRPTPLRRFDLLNIYQPTAGNISFLHCTGKGGRLSYLRRPFWHNKGGRRTRRWRTTDAGKEAHRWLLVRTSRPGQVTSGLRPKGGNLCEGAGGGDGVSSTEGTVPIPPPGRPEPDRRQPLLPPCAELLCSLF